MPKKNPFRLQTRPRAAIFESNSGFIYPFSFMPWNHPISLLKKGPYVIQRGRQALTMELLKATEGCEISQRPIDRCRSGLGWVHEHSGSSSEAGTLLGPSLLLGPGPFGLGRTSTCGSTLHCLSPAPLGSLVA